MSLRSIPEWEDLLCKLCVPDTQTVRTATEVVQQNMKDPASFLSLFQIVQSSNVEQARHLAAIFCRLSVFKHWDETPQNLQEEIKTICFQLITQSTTPRTIRKSVADIVARILQKTNQWNGFLDHLLQLVSSPEPSHREIGLYLFQSVLESESLRSTIIGGNMDKVLDLIDQKLQDSDQDVRIRALSCANSFINSLEESNAIVPKYIQILPKIIQEITFSIEESDDRVSVGFEILNTLTEDFMRHLQPVVPDLLRFTLNIAANESIDSSLRQHALYFIEFAIDHKPKSFLASNCLSDVVDLSFKVMTEDLEDDDNSITNYGSQIIDVLAIKLPSKYVWQPIMDRVVKCIQSPRVLDRKAAIVALTVISEGCADKVEDTVKDIMPWIIAGLKDEPIVRQSALVAISELAKNLSDAIEPYHETLVPLLLQGTKDPSDIICIKAFYAISHYMVYPETLMPHFEVLLSHLMDGLNHSNIEVKELAVLALAASISMAGRKFEPYFPNTIDNIKKWMSLLDPNSFTLRNHATECVAMMAGAVGRELFLPHFTDVVGITMSGLEHIDDPQVREHIYRFFEQVVRVYPEELSPYIPIVLPYILASCQSSDGLVYFNDETGFNIFPDSEDPLLNQEVTVKILESYMDEKAAAVSCLGWLLSDNCEASASFLESSVDLLSKLSKFDLYPPVGSAAIVSLVQAASGMVSLIDENYSWKKGECNNLPDPVNNLLEVLFETYKNIMRLTEQTIVRSAIESIGKLALTVGPSAVMRNMNDICSWLIAILTRAAIYQIQRESFDESEEDFMTFTIVLEIIVELSKSCGKLFVPFLPNLFNCFSPYLSEEAPPQYRECCLCTIAEIADEIEEEFFPFCEAFLGVSLNEMNPNRDDNILQYACWCIRQVLRFGKISPAKANEIWKVVNAFMGQDPSRSLLFDSLYGLIAQLVLSFPDLCPLDQILPKLVQELPLKMNAEPSGIIYHCLFQYLEAGHPSLVALLPNILELFIIEILSGDITEETKNRQIQFLKNFAQSHSAELDSVFNVVLQKQLADPNELAQLRHSLK